MGYVLTQPCLKSHALQHMYASLCVGSAIADLSVRGSLEGHHDAGDLHSLFDDDHAETMVAPAS